MSPRRILGVEAACVLASVRTRADRVARLALSVPELEYEIFYTLGHRSAEEHSDVKHTKEFLGWKPLHPFENYEVG